MIYILVGNKNKEKSEEIKKLTKDCELVFLTIDTFSPELLSNYAGSISLFGQTLAIISDNVLKENDLNKEKLLDFKNSNTTFIFIEDKMTMAEESKYKKYAEVLRYEEKITKQAPKINSFALADAYASRNKINTWMLYHESISTGAEPEAISGMLFWKIKMMILNGTRMFSIKELKNQSKELVALYHKAHRGEVDFVIGLEQFILSSLNK